MPEAKLLRYFHEQALIERLRKQENKRAGGGGISGKLRKWARDRGQMMGLYIQTGKCETLNMTQRLKFRIADTLVFSKIRAELGLQKVGQIFFVHNKKICIA